MTERIKNFISIAIVPMVAVLLSVVLSGCSVFSSDETVVKPVELKAMLSAGAKINPSKSNDANPVVITLYQLKSIEAFKSSQVLDLFLKDVAVLAEDIVKRETLPSLLPAEKRIKTLAIANETKYLAVFVQFSSYSQAKTKAWIEIKELDDIERVNISVESLTVNIESVARKSFWSW